MSFAYESIVCLIILLGCLSFSSSSTVKVDFLQLQCDPRTDLISLKKHFDQGRMKPISVRGVPTKCLHLKEDSSDEHSSEESSEESLFRCSQ